ncbi:MAG: DUF4124 domain-containing protein, partial [Nitrospirae bacterium]
MKKTTLVLLFFFALALGLIYTTSEATLYKWKDKKGQVHITDYPPPPEEVGLPTEEQGEPFIKKKPSQPEKETKVQEVSPPVEEPVPPPTVVSPQKKQQPKPQGVLKIPLHEKKKEVAPKRPTPQVKKTKPAPPRPKARRMPPPGGPSVPNILALVSFGGLFYMVFSIALSLLFYFYGALTLHLIGKKRGVSYAWTVWIPLVNGVTGLLVLLASAGRPLWWALFFVLPVVLSLGSVYMPVLSIVSLVVSIGLIILVIILWMDITRNLGLNKFLGLLIIVPIANLILMGYLAFKPEPDVEINKKKMVIISLVVYVVLVVLSAIGVQYLLIPYIQKTLQGAITGQMQKQLPLPEKLKLPKEKPKPKKLSPVQPMSPAAYDRVLQRKAPAFGEGPYTYAGP